MSTGGFDLSAKHQHALSQAKRLARSLDGVQGVDFGYRYQEGKRTKRLCLRFHMARKRSPGDVAPDQTIPNQIAGFATDVLEAGYQPHAGSPFEAHAALKPGISIGNVDRGATGTLGGFFRDRQDGGIHILSNWHVLCGGFAAQAGDTVSQPGPMHLGPNPARRVATLERWIAPDQHLDAAIARLEADVEVQPRLLGVELEARGIAEPQPGMALLKSGVMSGVTHALVDGIGGSYHIDYRGFGDQKRWMAGFRLVPDPAHGDEEISLGGDSGALWIESDTGLAVGLHFAGEDDIGPLNEYALAHSLNRIADVLNVELMT